MKDIYSINEMCSLKSCGGWVFVDNETQLAWGGNSNDLGLFNDLPCKGEEDYTDRLLITEKIKIKDRLFIFVGTSADNLKSCDISTEELSTKEELIAFIKHCWGL